MPHVSDRIAPVPATPTEELERSLQRLVAHKDAWLAVDVPSRIAHLKRCLAAVRDVSTAWVRDMCGVKGLSADTPLAGEEWVSGPLLAARNMRLLIDSLEARGQKKPHAIHTRTNGQKVARVLPDDLHDRLEFTGATADVWILPGHDASQGRIYREPKPDKGKVALVLGAGNVSSIPPSDALYKLFAEDQVVLLKMSPVNDVLGPHLRTIFASLIDAGFMDIVYGGPAEGAFLAEHPQVDTVHVTGSSQTYDAIVWGSDPVEQAQRKAQNQPRNPRPVTAELGAVTPVLVVPGDWSDKELQYQARHVAAMVTQNASFNCNAAKVLVLARGWHLRERFLDAVHAALRVATPRKAYYPGAFERYQRFLAHYPQALVLGERADGIVPWTAIPDVPSGAGEYALVNEAFCGVLAEVSLEVSTPSEFLREAVDFANGKCAGTLSCALLIDERSQEALAPELDAAIAGLRYGGIAINAWSAMVFVLCSPTWGAFPGHTARDIGSGIGVVHNTFLFDYPEKSVVKAPFMPQMTPGYFSDHRTLDDAGRALLDMETHLSAGAFFRLFWAGIRG